MLEYLHAVVGHGDILPVLAGEVAQCHRAEPHDGDVLGPAHARQAPHHTVPEHPAVRLADKAEGG